MQYVYVLVILKSFGIGHQNLSSLMGVTKIWCLLMW